MAIKDEIAKQMATFNGLVFSLMVLFEHDHEGFDNHVDDGQGFEIALDVIFEIQETVRYSTIISTHANAGKTNQWLVGTFIRPI